MKQTDKLLRESLTDESEEVQIRDNKARALALFEAWALRYRQSPYTIEAIEYDFELPILDGGKETGFTYFGFMDFIATKNGVPMPLDHKALSQGGPVVMERVGN